MADYNLKIIDNKVIFDGHAENSSDCHTLTLLCNLLQKNTKTIDYKMGYAEFELDDLPSENKFWLTYEQTFYINDILVRVEATQATSDSFISIKLTISLSFSQDGVTVHNTGNTPCQVRLLSDLDLGSYFSVTSISSISAGETALLPFLDNIKLRSILSSDGQEISEGDVISADGTKLTVSKIKSVDLTTLPGWSSLSDGSHNITIVAKADGYRDSEKSTGVEVTKSALPKTLEESTWAEIAQVSANKQWNAMGWKVGDSKTITLNGTVGTLALDNYQCKVYILGFDHNAEKEGQGISFGMLEGADGKQLCLADLSYDTFTTELMEFSMNTTNTNAGGWKAAKMRKTILGSTDVENGDATPNTIEHPATNTLMAALPADLRAVLKPLTKYTNNVGQSSEASAITTTIDYLPLMAEFEVFGVQTHANSNEKTHQAQYEYYKSGNDKIKYIQFDVASAANWWLRSPNPSTSYGFCCVYTDGMVSNYGADYSLGVAPAFLV